MTDQQQVPEDRSYVLIQFGGVGSVALTVQTNNVTPMQLLALAGYLEVMAKNQILRVENERIDREQSQALHVPTNRIEVVSR